jgi:hypothetical protein
MFDANPGVMIILNGYRSWQNAKFLPGGVLSVR